MQKELLLVTDDLTTSVEVIFGVEKMTSAQDDSTDDFQSTGPTIPTTKTPGFKPFSINDVNVEHWQPEEPQS